MKTGLFILITFHGLFHLAGFSRAFDLEAMIQLTQSISKPNGILWLFSAVIFVLTALLFVLKKDSWWMISAFGIVLSQYLVFTNWHDAKFGTIANIIILLAVISGYGRWAFRKKYKTEVITYLGQAISSPDSLDGFDFTSFLHA